MEEGFERAGAEAGERPRAFAAVPGQQKLRVGPGAVAVRREGAKRLKKFFRDQIRRTRC